MPKETRLWLDVDPSSLPEEMYRHEDQALAMWSYGWNLMRVGMTDYRGLIPWVRRAIDELEGAANIEETLYGTRAA